MRYARWCLTIYISVYSAWKFTTILWLPQTASRTFRPLYPLITHISFTTLLTASLCRYERSDIEKWFREHNTSPTTGQVLLSTTLVPNHQMRSRVLEWQVEDVFWMRLLHRTIESCAGAACGSQIILFDAWELASDAFPACAQYSLFFTCYSAFSSNLLCCRAAAKSRRKF